LACRKGPVPANRRLLAGAEPDIFFEGRPQAPSGPAREKQVFSEKQASARLEAKNQARLEAKRGSA
ncbi:MAG TPA: hypothetical protein VFV39_10550, partial [Limnobacter sp.]|nr:hypothetical protein [Limnobacter sp.]